MKKVRNDFYVLFGICIILLLFGTFFDYEISNFLYNRSSLFGRIVNVIAQIPTYILLTFFCMGIYNTTNNDDSASSLFSRIFGILGAAIFGFLAGYVFLLNMNLYSITMIIAADIGIVVCCYIVTKLISEHDEKNLRKYSKTIIYSFIISVIIVILLLTFFDRSPFRRLDGMVNIYLPWYQVKLYPSLSGYLHRSFPSMNMLMASFMLYINIFNTFARSFRKRNIIVSILGYSWIFIVALSELLLGYAYVSDLMISIIIEAIISILVFKIMFKRKASD